LALHLESLTLNLYSNNLDPITRFVAASTQNGPAVTSGNFGLVSASEGGSFPAALDLEDSPQCQPTQLKGELFTLTDDTFSALDQLEQHPNWYTRRLIRLDGHVQPAWMYIMKDESSLSAFREEPHKYSEVTPLGDWKTFVTKPDK